jgi:hypothetical protein
MQTSTKEFGDAVLQTRLAEELWRIMDKSATSHFVAAENPAALCNKIVQREQEQPETAAKVRKQRNNHHLSCELLLPFIISIRL